MSFTEFEREYLDSQPLGRIGTASATNEPDVAPVGFSLDDDVIEIGGLDNPKTIKHNNVKATGRASFVVDDLETTDPWRPRGIKVRGSATIGADANAKATIRIVAETIWSWGINQDADTYFAGRIEKRDA